MILKLIKLYQLYLSPFLPRSCRFYPSCSEYAMQAISKFGLVTGIFVAFKRLLRCHPYHPGGYNPV